MPPARTKRQDWSGWILAVAYAHNARQVVRYLDAATGGPGTAALAPVCACEIHASLLPYVASSLAILRRVSLDFAGESARAPSCSNAAVYAATSAGRSRYSDEVSVSM